MSFILLKSPRRLIILTQKMNDIESRLWMFMSKEEEKAYYYKVCGQILHNTRYYLDNLESLNTFTVSFINYGKKKGRKRKLYK